MHRPMLKSLTGEPEDGLPTWIVAAGLAAVLAASVAEARTGNADQRDHQPGPAALNPVVVTGSAFPHALDRSIQTVEVITRDQILESPAGSLAELLAQVVGVDVQRRGGPGVQADIGIRGSAFEQTLILLNGIPLRDPQTGHHNLNLPVPLETIERIEIVKGPGGLAFGGHATGGLVNIITRVPGASEGGLRARVGSHRFGEAAAWWGGGDSAGGQSLSLEANRSDGHLDDEPTDFELARASFTGERRIGSGQVNWGAGYERKKFGAYKFYTADFPDQRERTRTRLAYVSGQQPLGSWNLEARGWWRDHDDWFRTRVGNADFINRHLTRTLGTGLAARRIGTTAATGFGVNLLRERIDSNALGERERDEVGFWLSHRQQLGTRWVVEGGVSRLDLDQGGARWLPTLGANYRIDRSWTWYASGGRVSRPSSWTEQRLVTGGNRGNPELQAESLWLAETGLRWRQRQFQGEGALFRRWSDALIDWGRPPGAVQWQADYFDDYRSIGGELGGRWTAVDLAWLESVTLGYSWLDTELDARGLEIKYALDYPRHAIKAGARFQPSPNVRMAITLKHANRNDGRSSTDLALRMSWQPRRLEWFFEADNLLGDRTPEAGFAPQPGRWLFAGIRVGFY